MSKPTIDLQALASEAKSILPWISERRRYLHRNPELSFQEVNTARFVRGELEAMGYSPGPPIAEGMHGFTVQLNSPNDADRVILLRADMDALPIVEENDIPFKSENPGVGHLCGHDAHTAMLLGAAKLLHPRIKDLPCSVRLVFQHAEEVSPGGAIDFVKAGAMKDVVGCFGIHVSPRIESGRFGVVTGEAMAMVGEMRIVVRGRGGHGAAPHEAIDPVPAAAAVILALQQIVSRRLPPIEPGVISVTKIHAGTANNVIPQEVELGGTMRTYNESRAPEIARAVTEIAEHTARAWNCEAEVVTSWSYPPVINAAAAIDAARDTMTFLFGEGAAVPIDRSMGAEDFAYFAREKPSAFLFLGVRPAGATFYPLHHPKFLPDADVLWKGSALLAAMPFTALDYLDGRVGLV